MMEISLLLQIFGRYRSHREKKKSMESSIVVVVGEQKRYICKK